MRCSSPAPPQAPTPAPPSLPTPTATPSPTSPRLTKDWFYQCLDPFLEKVIGEACHDHLINFSQGIMHY